MNMSEYFSWDYWRGYKPNTWQTIALTGFATSLVSQVLLRFIGKEVANFHYLYPVWAGVLLFGTWARYYWQEPPHDDHDHDHEEDFGDSW